MRAFCRFGIYSLISKVEILKEESGAFESVPSNLTKRTLFSLRQCLRGGFKCQIIIKFFLYILYILYSIVYTVFVQTARGGPDPVNEAQLAVKLTESIIIETGVLQCRLAKIP